MASQFTLSPVNRSDRRYTRSRESTAFIVIALAGLVGGMAEVLWMALYNHYAPPGIAEVSRQVVFSLFPDSMASSAAPINGLIIHLSLSLLLATTFALLVWRPFMRDAGLRTNLLAGSAVLGVVWVVNFFIVLPVVNPAFVQLMPYSVTFVSKLLFGVAMGFTLYRFGCQPAVARSLKEEVPNNYLSL